MKLILTLIFIWLVFTWLLTAAADSLTNRNNK